PFWVTTRKAFEQVSYHVGTIRVQRLSPCCLLWVVTNGKIGLNFVSGRGKIPAFSQFFQEPRVRSRLRVESPISILKFNGQRSSIGTGKDNLCSNNLFVLMVVGYVSKISPAVARCVVFPPT